MITIALLLEQWTHMPQHHTTGNTTCFTIAATRESQAEANTMDKKKTPRTKSMATRTSPYSLDTYTTNLTANQMTKTQRTGTTTQIIGRPQRRRRKRCSAFSSVTTFSSVITLSSFSTISTISSFITISYLPPQSSTAHPRDMTTMSTPAYTAHLVRHTQRPQLNLLAHPLKP